jgi:hypothetical protein
MDKKELKDKINEVCSNKNVRFPSEIEISTLGTMLQITIKGDAIFNNMQTDGAAFEGWAVCLKAWLPDVVNNVELAWSTPHEEEDGKNKWFHYHRFLYRVLRFNELYDWFSISKDNQQEIEDFKKKLVGLQNNSFSEKPKLKGEKNDRGEYVLSETVLEFVLKEYLSDLLKKKFDLDFIDRQFPVGVKQYDKQFFTGGLSAIDLWGTKDDKVTIFELKYNGNEATNIKVGIISELFMYSCIMRDILKGLINMPETTPNNNEQSFYEKGKKKQYRSIIARMLSDRFHPLVNNQQVFDILNHQTMEEKDIQISYYMNTYKLLEIE